MSKILLIYKSRTGFTQKYAEMIAKNIQCDIYPFSELRKVSLSNYDTIVFGSRVHAGIIDSFSKVKKIAKDSNLKLVLFATGATTNESIEIIEGVWKSNLSPEELQSVPHFYMQSGMNYEKMGFMDRTIMKLMSKKIEKNADSSGDSSKDQMAITMSHDISSEEYIKPLVEYVKGM